MIVKTIVCDRCGTEIKDPPSLSAGCDGMERSAGEE